MRSTFAKLSGLELVVDACLLEPLRAELGPGRTRQCTLVTLNGDGASGVGEDVGYEADEQEAFLAAGPPPGLTGRFTLERFCARVESLDLFPAAPRSAVSRLYRVWALQSAALDLSLRQAGVSLADAVGRAVRPMRYVASTRLGEPPTIEPVTLRLSLDPTLRFKLDATSSWTPELIAQLVATGAVEAVDFKGFYRGSSVDQPADPVLYRRVAEAFPDAWLEDPDLSDPAAAAALAGEHHRITWDAPIHSIQDIQALPFKPAMVNVKPSRIGTLAKLMDTYDYCEEHEIDAYGGGQTEIGPGRGQCQYLAALFHADAPNDLAPAAYNLAQPPAGLPPSPLRAELAGPGFRWA
jgi:L-alanine-DL-glutamate epimerase-like enolase superfamily enzyme